MICIRIKLIFILRKNVFHLFFILKNIDVLSAIFKDTLVLFVIQKLKKKVTSKSTLESLKILGISEDR